jgi:hypothetical protein
MFVGVAVAEDAIGMVGVPDATIVGDGVAALVGDDVAVEDGLLVAVAALVGDEVAVEDRACVVVAVADRVAVVVGVLVDVEDGVGVAVAVLVDVRVRVAVADGVAVGVEATSTEPTSYAKPCGRLTPRWSMLGAPLSVPLSIAALPAPGRWVGVNPPLTASRPSLASTSSRPAPKLQELSEDKLKTALATGRAKAQLPPAGLSAMRTFFRASWVFVPVLKIPPPSEVLASLPANVTLVSIALPPSFFKPPP